MDFYCFLCGATFILSKEAIKHLKKIHFIKDNTEPITCIVRNCRKTFNTFSGLSNHAANFNHVEVLPPIEIAESVDQALNSLSLVDYSEHTRQNELSLQQSTSFEFTFPYYEEVNKFSEAIVFENYNQSSSTKATEHFHSYLSTFATKVINMDLKQSDTNSLFKMSIELIKEFKDINQKWMAEVDSKTDSHQTLELTYDISRNFLSSFNSTYKRNKTLSSDKQFVAPISKAIGTRYEMKKIRNQKGRIIYIPRLIQCTLQYVPILETLKSLFLCEKFASLYFEYNQSNGSNLFGRDGTKLYNSFSSGTSFSKIDIFQAYPDSLQLQISVDEVEPCNALQSKSNIHKIVAVYFAIHNMPPKYSSKLNNIYLVCLCNSNDLKSRETDFNDIWQMIVNEISELETNGIMIAGGRNLKGTLVHISADNLGANVGEGYSGSFSANKFCRHCLSSKKECQSFTKESQCTLRTLDSYDRSLDIIAESERVNLDETDGVKFYCTLNNLNYFHILENPTADIMHDLNEGCIPELLTHFFKFIIKEKILTWDQLDNMIKSHDYGVLSTKNIPSEINLSRRSLGQNAAQSMCLFRNIPFILHRYEANSKLKEAWKCIQALLEICEIVYSNEVTELNLDRLQKVIELYLDLYKKVFRSELIPKQHFLLHYATIIRKVGPLSYFDMFRFDAKHRQFKIFRNATNNFISLNKSLAFRHQKQLLARGFSYKDDIEYTVPKLIEDQSILNILTKCGILKYPLYEIKNLHYNNLKYEKGLVIVFQNSLFEIDRIIFVEEDFYFICYTCSIEQFDHFFNGFKVQKTDTDDLVAIHFSQLVYVRSHDLKVVYKNYIEYSYIISDNLDLKKHLGH